MGYREEYYKILDKLKNLAIDYYDERLMSFVVFGSVARDTFRPDSDIDILIVAKELPIGRIKRLQEFEENVESKIERDIFMLRKKGIYPYISPIIKTPEEVKKGSPLFLDMTEKAKILFDRDRFFQQYMESFQEKLKKLGARKVFFKGGYYWLLKPDYKPGDIIEL